jgi:hypothetical protein
MAVINRRVKKEYLSTTLTRAFPFLGNISTCTEDDGRELSTKQRRWAPSGLITIESDWVAEDCGFILFTVTFIQ